MKTQSKKHETTQEKIARLKRKRRALEQDKHEFGFYPDLDEDEIEELEWLSDHEEAMAEMRAEYLEERRRGLY